MEKMKKRFCSLKKSLGLLGQVCLLGFVCANSQAQWKVGLVAGVNKNHLQTSTVFATSQVRFEDKWGKETGITLQKTITDWFILGTGLIGSEKSYERRRTGYFQEEYQVFKNSFVQVPITGMFRFGGPKLKGFMRLGANTDIWVHKRTQGSLYNVGDMFPTEISYPKGLLSDEGGFSHFNLKERFNAATDRVLQVGFQFGLGLQYQISDKMLIELEFLEQQQQSMVKNYMREVVPRRNNTQHLRLSLVRNLTLSTTRTK